MMVIDPIQSGVLPTAAPASGTHTAGSGFAQLLGAGLERLDTTVQAADGAMQSFALGENIPVHDVMIAMERAQLAMQFAVAVRNRVVGAYQTFLRMQI